ncbi:MAG TPA: NAD(P)H-hydrate dehydratase [Chloroflexi bacterium]|nr:NAD(P)H-hydrate dehydratase [Chloroflexota bacterium]
MKVSRVAEMRQLDRTAIEKYAIPGTILMENAGGAAYHVILQELGVRGKTFVVVCGNGHNGGDGLVVARKLHSTGARVHVFCLGSPQKFDDTVRFHYEMLAHIGLPFTTLGDDLTPLRSALATADAAVDAIFGTGLSRPVAGRYAEAIRLLNASGKPVFSLDIPSGIAGDTGQVLGVAVEAAATITFGLPKPGNLLYPGFRYGGKLFVTHISFPLELYTQESLNLAVNDPLPLPPRPRDGHKGTFGKVLFIAGGSRYLGAPYFAAMAFLKAGGGLAYLATAAPAAPFIASKGSEIVVLPQPATDEGTLALEALDGLLEAAAPMDMVVLGPGLSLHPESQALARRLTQQLEKPLLVDGDGLTALAGHPELVRSRTAPTALTPHPGEMARLTGRATAEIQADRIAALQAAVAQWQATIVLKGAHSLIGTPEAQVFINLSGNPGMGTAGSGDVLTGTIAAMHTAHGFPLPEATRMGVFVHGLAGDLAAASLGEDGVVAGDILAYLPHALRHLRQHGAAMAADHYGQITVV